MTEESEEHATEAELDAHREGVDDEELTDEVAEDAGRTPNTLTDETPVSEVVAKVSADVESHDRDLREEVLGGLTETIIKDWTAAFAHLRPGVSIDREDNARLQQVRQFFERNEEAYEALAAEIGISAYRGLRPGQVLFMTDLRRLQATFRDEIGSAPNVTPNGLEDLFRDRLSVVDADADGARSVLSDQLSDLKTHPLGAQLLPSSPATAYRVTDTPAQFRSMFVHRAIPFDSDTAPSPGDVVFFHADGEFEDDASTVDVGGYIGCAIVGEQVTGAQEWFNEFYTDPTNGAVFSFSRLYLTGAVERLDLSRPTSAVAAASDDSLERELDALCTNATSVGESATRPVGRSDELTGDEPVSESIIIFRMIRSALQELPPTVVRGTFDGALPNELLNGLYFPDRRGDRILRNIEAALRSGKSIMLTGPPGTGKTEIAERVLEYVSEAYPNYFTGFRTTTATADWSTFDTIGGYMPDRETTSEQLVFTPGLVTACLYDQDHECRLNEPLLVDELNRADIDKAFGQLFTALTDKSVQLPFTTDDGTPLTLVTPERAGTVPGDSEYLLPRSWCLLATINTYDKTSLYEMSYAFMRRFAVIRVDPPMIPESPSERNQLIAAYANCWGNEVDETDLTSPGRTALGDLFAKLGELWFAVNSTIDNRAIGPAILKDITDTVRHHSAWPASDSTVDPLSDRQLEELLTDSVIAYVLPQFEGIPERKEIVLALAQCSGIDEFELVAAAKSSLDLPELSLDHGTE